jgi:hypothetical protein
MPVAGSGKTWRMPFVRSARSIFPQSLRESPFRRCLLSAIGAALLIISRADPELGLGAWKCDQRHSGKETCHRGALPNGRARFGRKHTPSGGGLVWGAGRKQAEVVSVIERCESPGAADRGAVNHQKLRFIRRFVAMVAGATGTGTTAAGV